MLDLILEFWWIEVVVVLAAIVAVYGSLQVHSVPALRSISSPPPMVFDEQLLGLNFQFVESCDASMSPQVQMHVHLYLSSDRSHVAMIARVRSTDDLFSVVEFVSELSPYATLTTSTSKSASIFRWPAHKMVFKVPWKKTADKVFGLHQALCDAAREELFFPVTLDGGRLREKMIEHIRHDYEHQAKRGIVVRVAPDRYRLSLKGAVFSVPLVWAKMVYPIFYDLYHPSNAALCRRLTRRLRKLRATPEPARVG